MRLPSLALLAWTLSAAAQPGIIFQYSKDHSAANDVLRKLKGELDHVIKIQEVEESGKAAVRYTDTTGKSTDLKGAISPSAVTQFLRQSLPLVFGGEKKEAKQASAGSVLKLTGKTFNPTVMSSDKAFFVKFFAPWCGHCKAMAGDWKELARQTDAEAIVIAEVDADAETDLAREYGIKGFPTLLLFPAGAKSKSKVIPYDGHDRSMASLMAFVSKHAKNAGGKVKQLISDRQFREECSQGLCMITFLPNILDTQPATRKSYIKVLNDVRKETADLPIKHFWAEAGHSIQLEQYYRLEFGWPATIIVNQQRQVFVTHRGRTTVADLTEFAGGVVIGKYKADALDASTQPEWPSTPRWDGKGAKLEEL